MEDYFYCIYCKNYFERKIELLQYGLKLMSFHVNFIKIYYLLKSCLKFQYC